MQKSTGLGRGLSALLPDAARETSDAFRIVPLKDISPNPQQPRRDFHAGDLDELAASIREKGVIQPLVVRIRKEGGYELVAGERRLRAAKLAGYTEAPVRIIEATTDLEMLELSIIENLQREDLNAVELARGYRRLHDDYGLTQEQVAQRVGKDRATVANMLRLLELPEAALTSLRNGEISVGHAKAILTLRGAAARSALWKRVVSGGMSVRETEEAARTSEAIFEEAVNPTEKKLLTPSYYRDYAVRLQEKLGTKVRIVGSAKKGTIRIGFASAEELERLMEIFNER